MVERFVLDPRNQMRPQPLDWLGKTRPGVTPTIIGSVLVLEPNPKRRYAIFCNDSINIMYLFKGAPGAVNTGIRVNANGGSYEINLTNPYFGAISVACGVAAQNLTWIEEE